MQASLVRGASTAAAAPLQISVAIFEAMTNGYCTWMGGSINWAKGPFVAMPAGAGKPVYPNTIREPRCWLHQYETDGVYTLHRPSRPIM